MPLLTRRRLFVATWLSAQLWGVPAAAQQPSGDAQRGQATAMAICANCLMPDPQLSRQQVDDVVSYIVQRRRQAM